ncbi:hypothetical protein IV500_05880 [Paeniglutamicibacter antarcticus]|uniref:Uncharacterized protein n=1 Tax=Arthrobacter terrae TaxID=2935737 RepID=A0A931CI00_9MICC|nr:hypothetical protein [Arthrobacter terrae]MBG0738952.1 hypothetical protein [Arthrobacter terrae]
MSEYIHPPAVFPPVLTVTGDHHTEAPTLLPARTSKAQSVLRIFAGLVSITVGFWGGSAAVALNSMATLLGPRFTWLGFLLGFAALCSVITGSAQIIWHTRKDLRIPALSMAFAAISVLAYVAVFVALPLVTPMLGGLVLSGLGIILIALTTVFDA